MNRRPVARDFRRIDEPPLPAPDNRGGGDFSHPVQYIVGILTLPAGKAIPSHVFQET
jgi:hypothetical protein